MPVPKRRKTKSRRNQRRQHLKLKRANFSICPKCKGPVLPHQVCPNCGYYKGKEVVNVLAKLERKERKKREKEIAKKEKEETKKEPRAPRKKPLSMGELSKRSFFSRKAP